MAAMAMPATGAAVMTAPLSPSLEVPEAPASVLVGVLVEVKVLPPLVMVVTEALEDMLSESVARALDRALDRAEVMESTTDESSDESVGRAMDCCPVAVWSLVAVWLAAVSLPEPPEAAKLEQRSAAAEAAWAIWAVSQFWKRQGWTRGSSCARLSDWHWQAVSVSEQSTLGMASRRQLT